MDKGRGEVRREDTGAKISKVGPVRVSQRAEFWVVPSRSQQGKVRFVVIWGSKPRHANCSCPAGEANILCHHVTEVNQEMLALQRKKVKRGRA